MIARLVPVLILLSFGGCDDIKDSDFEIRTPPAPTIKVVDSRNRSVVFKGLYYNSSIYTPGSQDAVEAYLGIPFATKPIGNNRFKEAAFRPVHTLGRRLDATQWKPGCLQEPGIFTNDTHIFSEDCLYLNIWRRRGTPGADLRPVVVIIYGGGYVAGDGHEYDWRGPQMAFFEDLVVVNFNYRLGVFGFLDLGLPDGAAGHQGHLDQVLALKWVNQYIKSFGGDPDRVTLFGVSAGSFSMSWHLLTGFSAGLFHAAVIDAGVLTYTQAETQKDHVSRAQRMVKASDCRDLDEIGDQATKPQRQKILNCLMRLDGKKLVKLQEQYGASQTYTFRPTFNNRKYLPRSPTCMTNEKEFAVNVPIIIGDTTNEGLFLLTHKTHDPLPSFSNFDEVLEWDVDILKGHHLDRTPVYGPKNRTIKSIYDSQPNEVTPDPEVLLDDASQIIGDGLFVCPVMNFADRYSSIQSKVYFYRWERIRVNETFPHERENGAYHGLMFYTGSGSEYLYLKGQMVAADKFYIQKTIKMIADFASNPTTPLAFNGTSLEAHSSGGAVNNFDIDGLEILTSHPKIQACRTVWPVFAEQKCTQR